jgi:hypothetical protein
MKTMKHNIYKVGAILVMVFAFILPSKAQTTENYYANIDWQYNFPLGIDFADKSSGWGMNFEGGYFLTENFSIGAFLAYHSNHKYIPRQDIILSEGATLNTDQQHTLFQMPFGATGRYTFNRGEVFQPYVSAKMGLQYARLKSDFNVFQNTKGTWGFYMSPEVGINIFPWFYKPGFHVAAYYSYATNSGHLMAYSVDGMSNFGLRAGIAF